MRQKLKIILRQIFFVAGAVIFMTACEEGLYTDQAPTLEILSPEKGQKIPVGDTLNFAVRATDDKDSLKEVRFYVGERQAGIDCTMAGQNRYELEIPIEDLETGNLDISAEAVDAALETTREKTEIEVTIGIEYVAVEGGTFEMGQPNPDIGGNGKTSDEQPVHEVKLDPYEISKYEITNAQFAAFLNEVGANPDGTHDKDYNSSRYGYIYLDYNNAIRHNGQRFVVVDSLANNAVQQVTWFGARAFCENYNGQLPTEAQWEFAARGGNQAMDTKYSGSNNLSEVGVYIDPNNRRRPADVGLKNPNELGIYDMSGNAAELCRDLYKADYYENSQFSNPQGAEEADVEEKRRCLRGGGYASDAEDCRVASRKFDDSSFNSLSKNMGIGFRILRIAK